MTMEVTGTKLDQVHVLRQTFRPNGPFQEILSELVTTGSNGPRLFYGSDELVLNAADAAHRELEAEKHVATRQMERKQNLHFQVGNEVKVRDLKDRTRERGLVAVQLVIVPPPSIEFRHVVDVLDSIKVGQRRQAIGFLATRLYMTIPADQLVPDYDFDEVIERMNKTLADPSARRKYQVTPHELLDHTMILPRQRPSIDTYPENTAS